MINTDGCWLIDDLWQPLRCLHDQRVRQLEPIDANPQLPRFMSAPVDLHVHGGGGADVMQGRAAIECVLHAHARGGTGALLATSVTSPFDDIDCFLRDVKAVMENPPPGGAQLLGAHLEGPFINPDKLGAQPPHASAVDETRLEEWLASGVVRVMTYAPEQDPGKVVPALCRQYNVKMQLGHTLCTWSQAQAAIGCGAGVTHLFNAMSGVLHRAIPHLYSVTDATAGAGMPDGPYQLGELGIIGEGAFANWLEIYNDKVSALWLRGQRLELAGHEIAGHEIGRRET